MALPARKQLFTTVPLTLAASGAIGPASSTVDVAEAIAITASASGLTFTLPQPTDSAAPHRLSVVNVGSNTFMLYGMTVSPGNFVTTVYDPTLGWLSPATSTLAFKTYVSGMNVAVGDWLLNNGVLFYVNTAKTNLTTPPAPGTDFTVIAPGFGVRLYASSAQAIPHSTYTPVIFQTQDYNSNGWFTVAQGTYTTVRVPQAGIYAIDGNLTFDTNSSGARAAIIWTDTDGVSKGYSQGQGFSQMANASGVSSVSFGEKLKFNKGDYIYIGAYQYSGASLNLAIDATTKAASSLSIAYVGA